MCDLPAFVSQLLALQVCVIKPGRNYHYSREGTISKSNYTSILGTMFKCSNLLLLFKKKGARDFGVFGERGQ